MMNENGQPLLLEGAAPDPEGANPFKLVMRIMRGRYLWAVALGLLFAVPAALIGYKAMPPVFTSQGIVVVNAKIPTMIYDDEINPIGQFDAYLRQQATFIASRRVKDRASLLLEENLPSWPRGTPGVRELSDGLRVEPSKGGSTILVGYTSRDPKTAQACVNAVLDAYDEIFGEESEFQREDIERRLRDTVRSLSSRKETLERQISREASVAGSNSTDLLETRQNELAQRLVITNRMIDQLRLKIAGFESGTELSPEDPPDVMDLLADIPPEVLARNDEQLGTLLDQQGTIRSELDRLELQGFGPGHRLVVRLNNRLTSVQNQIRLRIERMGEIAGGSSGGETPMPREISQVKTLDQARTMLGNVEKIYNQADIEYQSVSDSLVKMRNLRDELGDVSQQLDEAQRELSKREIENADRSIARIQIAQRGDIPFAPSSDKRVVLAAGGAMGGLGFGVALVALFGFMRLSYNYIDDLEELQPGTPLLGVVPDLADPSAEEDANAALCVHHLRNLLQVRHGRGERARIYTVTSPTAGDGKTSLTLALGISFAAIGRRTLIVDADLVAGGLSRQVGLSSDPGLWQALQRGSVNGEIYETQHLGLWAMPGGISEGVEPERLSIDGLRAVLDDLADDYDTILMDTGPLLGALDATLSAANSDDVILTVRRGQKPRLVKAAIERMRTLGVSCAGIVFNMASWEDLRSNVSPASLNSSSMRSVPPDQREKKQAKRGAPRRSLGGAVAGRHSVPNR